MNVAYQPWTTERFLAWEARQERKFEFDGFQPLAMVGVRAAHSTIQRNTITALANRLRGKTCQPHGSDLKIAVANGSIRYPDAFVVCTPVAPDATIVHDPVVVFEILSESSATTDLVVKNSEYRATPSIQHYVVLEQTRAVVVVFSRAGGEWVAERLAGADAIVRLPEIGIDTPITELYLDVTLTGPEAGETASLAP